MSSGKRSPEKHSAKSKHSAARGDGCDSSSDSESDDDAMKLEEQLTYSKLKQLESIFEDADEDGGGGLDMDEFRIAMRKAMGDHLSDHELDILFMKVDTNCDGTVDWDEYLSYMLLEYRGKDDMNMDTKVKPLPKHLRKVQDMNRYQRHHDTIIGVTYMPNLVKKTNTLYKCIDDNNGKYLTVTKDGIVNFWTVDLTHVRRHRVTHPPPTHSVKRFYTRRIGVWVTTFTILPNLNIIAVATTSCNICFYDLTANKFSLVLNIMNLEISATCMDYWVHPSIPHKAQLMWGDTRGNITVLIFDDCPTMSFLQPSLNKHHKTNVELTDVVRGLFCGVSGYIMRGVHADLVVSVRYIFSLGTFLSCCRDRNTALFQGDPQGKKAIYFKVSKGVFAFDYCPYNNVLVTGGKDTIVRVWNPYVQTKPVMILQGHKSPVFYVMINSKREEIVSISEDKEINIFDMSTQTCIQTIFRKWVPLGPRPIAAVYFNIARQALVIGNNNLAIFEHQEEEIKTQQLTSHVTPVTHALYNSLFHQIVTGAQDSIVYVWEASTGERIIQFTAHTKRSKGGEEIAVEITSMKFDPTMRRLFTGARDGNVRMWNFNNGALLRELSVGENKEVTSILVARQRILIAGWNQRINVFMDDTDDDEFTSLRRVHREDIHTMALLSPGTIASASFDGDIVIWALETGDPITLFNAGESVSPILISQRISQVKCKNNRCKSRQSNESRTNSRMSKFSSAKSRTSASSRTSKRHCEVCKNSHTTGTENSAVKNMTYASGSIERLVFLESRERCNKATANLVSIGADGWIRFWSIHPDGGLRGQFNGAHHQGDTLLSVTTDQKNNYIITGCSSGYVKVWDIANYCVDPYEDMEKDQAARDAKHRKQFVYVRERACGKIWRQRVEGYPPPASASEPGWTLSQPQLLSSHQAHSQSITFIEFIDRDQRIITCSTDCSVRVWTIEGRFVGICGRETPWEFKSHVESMINLKVAMNDNSDEDQLQKGKDKFNRARKTTIGVPADIRHIASATTMRVLWGGIRPHWKLAKNIMTIWIPMLRMLQKNQPQRFKEDLNIKASASLKTSLLSMGDHESLVLPEIAPARSDSVILGKSYKPTRKHQRMPPMPKIRQFNNLCDVYSSLNCYSLTPLDPEALKPPQSLIEIKERNKKMVASSHNLAQKTGQQGGTRKTRTNMNSFKLKPLC